MHSRIFQISTTPIDKDNYIVESDYYDHWFTNQIADYVDDDCDRDEDIKWLGRCGRGYVIDKDDNGYYIIINNKEEYFARAFIKFAEELKKIGAPTIDKFINHSIDLWNLNNAYENKSGFYVENCDYDYGSELITLDCFIRSCKVGQKYYIGGTIDYHF